MGSLAWDLSLGWLRGYRGSQIVGESFENSGGLARFAVRFGEMFLGETRVAAVIWQMLGVAHGNS